MKSELSARSLKVLAFAGLFLPGYKGGGPIKTVKNLFDQLGEEISFKLVTSDRDLGDQEPYTDVVFEDWNLVGNASVFYIQKGFGRYFQIARIIKNEKYDIIYLNSFFSKNFSLYPLLLSKMFGRKVILSPRGEFSEGALELKALKKKFFISVFKLLRLHRGIVFQVSSQFEARDVRRVLGRVDIQVAENIAGQEFGQPFHERQAGILRAVFVSRISPMKNLLAALESLRKVKHPLVYDIYGPIEDADYWQKCEEVVRTLPNHIKVEYKGSLNPSDVIETINRYDVFYLPTKGENYGHAISEAFCAGVPALIANTTPWRNLQSEGVGWDLPLDNLEAFSEVLDELASMSNEEYRQVRRRVLRFAKDKFSQMDAIKANRALFKYAYEKR